jgi:DTW domain-containing protein YfiP
VWDDALLDFLEEMMAVVASPADNAVCLLPSENADKTESMRMPAPRTESPPPPVVGVDQVWCLVRGAV